ncbi:MAG: C/D box methylation guide ribonucleoprotein complex aNOP56 subunit [Candidatus Thorarchaeota archaeon]|jgi:nucleolar protein 56
MGSYLTYTAFGIFLLDEESQVLAEQIIYPDLDAAVENIRQLSEGTSIDYLKLVLEKTDSSITVADSNLAKAIAEISDIDVKVEPLSKVIKWFHSQHDTRLIENSVTPSSSEIQTFRHKVGVALAKSAVSEAGEEKDPSIKHAIDSVDEIDKSINIIAMRLREWYSIHFPSLNELIEDHEEYTRVVNVCGKRSNMTPENLTKSGISDVSIEKIRDSTGDMLGSDLTDSDMSAIHTLTGIILNLFNERRVLEGYISELMEEVAPNITSLVGPLVGARLISLAGSLKELARKPSSTLQILGAEKALFRSLKTGADPPKHGVIYQVAEIHSAPYWQRGKIARALAGKLSLAARIDAYSEARVVESLKTQFQARLEEIQRQNPEAPPPKPPKPKQPSKQRRPQRRHGRGQQRGRKGGRRQ